jgi:adenylosuccinate synthase
MAQLIGVVGLGYGDEGKGSITDWLTRRHRAKLVVRFNGGGQAAHNVVTPDYHHTFSQFGSGTLAGARTHLSRFVLIDPFAMAAEEKALRLRCNVRNPYAGLSVEEESLVVTPFHRAANRLREFQRGADAHGTCGMGIGETVSDHLREPEMVLRVGDLSDVKKVVARLEYWRAHKLEEFADVMRDNLPPRLEREAEILRDRGIVSLGADVFSTWANGVKVVDRDWLSTELDSEGTVIFEGAQGVLLDEDWGAPPHTTWSRCTFANAQELAGERAMRRIGVTRSYLTRHGAGPLSTQAEELADLPELHNSDGGWQGSFRRGWLHLGLLRYAVGACGSINEIAMNHLDRCLTGAVDKVAWSSDLIEPMPRGVQLQELIDRALGVPLTIGSVGPSAQDKFTL